MSSVHNLLLHKTQLALGIRDSREPTQEPIEKTELTNLFLVQEKESSNSIVTQQQDFIKRLLHIPAIGTEPLRQEPALQCSFSIQFLEKTQCNSQMPSLKTCGPLQGTV